VPLARDTVTELVSSFSDDKSDDDDEAIVVVATHCAVAVSLFSQPATTAESNEFPHCHSGGAWPYV